MERMREGKGESAMEIKTLIKILKCIGGIELHYRIERTKVIERVWIERPCMKGGK